MKNCRSLFYFYQKKIKMFDRGTHLILHNHQISIAMFSKNCSQESTMPAWYIMYFSDASYNLSPLQYWKEDISSSNLVWISYSRIREYGFSVKYYYSTNLFIARLTVTSQPYILCHNWITNLFPAAQGGSLDGQSKYIILLHTDFIFQARIWKSYI